MASVTAWSLFDTLKEGVLIVNNQGDLIYANEAALTLLTLDNKPLSLIDTAVSTHPNWKLLLDPPFELHLQTVNGRALIVNSHPVAQADDLVQIQITPNIEEALARSHEFKTLFEANRDFAGTLDKDKALALMGKQLSAAIDGEGYIIYRWDAAENALAILKEDGGINAPASPVENGLISLDKLSPVYETLITQKPRIIQSEIGSSTLLYEPVWMEKGESYVVVILPILMAEESYGVVELFSRSTNLSITEIDLQLLIALSNQANMALETALVFEDVFEREKFYNALGRMSLAINFELEKASVLNLISDESRRIFDVDGAYIWQCETERLVGVAANGDGAEEFVGLSIPVNDMDVFAAMTARTGEVSYVNYVQKNGRYTIKLPNSHAIQAALAIPLEQEGQTIAVLVLVDNHNPARFQDRDITRASTFGIQVAIALKNAHLFEELRQLNDHLDARVAQRTEELKEEGRRFETLLRITSELSSSLDQDYVLGQALRMINAAVDASKSAVLLIDQATDRFLVQAVLGFEDADSVSGMFPRDKGLSGWIVENRSPVIVDNAPEDTRCRDNFPSEVIHSILGVPLISNGEVIGILLLFNEKRSAFSVQQLALVEAAAIQVANAVNNANLYLLIRDQAGSLGALLRDEKIEAAKSQAILESIADGVVVADEEGKVVLANRPATRILGIEHEALAAKSIEELLGLYGNSGNSWLETVTEWANSPQNIQMGAFLAEQFEIEDKFISTHMSPVMANEQFYGIVAIFRDITQAVEVDKLKSEFVSTISHELRTPMTSIKGYADLLLMGAAGSLTDAQTNYLNVIRTNAARLHMLVNDLLDISKIESSKTTLDSRPLNIAQLVEQVVDRHLNGRLQQENKPLTIQTNFPPSLPLVHADHARVKQILVNLLDNAFNYTPEHGRIEVSANVSDHFVYVSIKDTGIGISKENLDKIFDRFFRSSNADVQKVSGTGLGLSIVNSLVEMHGGTLNVESEVNRGSTFTFSLPVAIGDGDSI